MTTTDTQRTETILCGPGGSTFQPGDRIGYLPGGQVDRAKAVVEDVASAADARWVLRSPAGHDAPTRQQAVVWDYVDGLDAATGYQVWWVEA